MDLDGVIPRTWTGKGNVWTTLETDGSRTVRWSLGRSDGKRGELRVWFDQESENAEVSAVQLSLPDGLTPTTLQRFPWARWIAVADASRRMVISAGLGPGSELFQAVEAARDGTRPSRGTPGARRGRPGLPDEHYQDVARRYLELRSQGETSPTATIAEEREANRNTVAGWVRGARNRGYLPEARRGRAG